MEKLSARRERQREADVLRLAPVEQAVAGLGQVLVVAAREAQQRRLLAAGVFEALLAYLDDPLRRSGRGWGGRHSPPGRSGSRARSRGRAPRSRGRGLSPCSARWAPWDNRTCPGWRLCALSPTSGAPSQGAQLSGACRRRSSSARRARGRRRPEFWRPRRGSGASPSPRRGPSGRGAGPRCPPPRPRRGP